MRRPLGFLAGASLAGCSLLSGLGDLSSGDGADAAPPPPVDGAAPTTADGGAAAREDASSRLCPKPGAFVCDDFDDDPPDEVPFGWKLEIDTGCSLKVSSAHAKSAPHALAVLSGAGSFCAATRPFSNQNHLRISFDMDIEARATNLTALRIANAADYTLYFQPYSATETALTESVRLSDGGTDYASTSGPPVPTGRFVHVVVDVDFASKVATATVEGVELVRRNLAGSSWTANLSGVVGFGPVNSAAAQLHVDNVLVEGL